MRDAELDTWKRDSQVPAELLVSLRALNCRFLELITALPPGWDPPRQGLDGATFAQIAQLSSAQRAAVANCPYALFDVHFDDEVRWRARLRAPVGFVAEANTVTTETLEFVRLAIFFAWHAANTPASPRRFCWECTRARWQIFIAPVLIGCRHSPRLKRRI